MIQGVHWQLVATVVGALSALVAVPLTAIVLYLRVIREDQRTVQAALSRRADLVEAECRRLEEAVEGIERAYTPKEEWVRESMLARKQLARLTELMARLQAELESSRALAGQFARSTNAIIRLAEVLAGGLTGPRSPVGFDREET